MFNKSRFKIKMKDFRNILLFMFGFLGLSLNACAWNIPEDITFIGLEKIAGEVKKAVFSIQDKDPSEGFIPKGTGFLIQKWNLVIGITCEHVVSPFLEEGKDIFVGLNTSKGFERFRGKVVMTDETNDIAILVFEKRTEEQIKIENLVLDSKYLESISHFSEGRAVLIPGYPLGIGAKQNENNPVIRFGIVAQCSGRTNFLIDGVANPGNSGSPVFDIKEMKFIGMVTSYATDFINLFNKKKQLIAKLPYNSGLSSAVSTTVIVSLLEKLEKSPLPAAGR